MAAAAAASAAALHNGYHLNWSVKFIRIWFPIRQHKRRTWWMNWNYITDLAFFHIFHIFSLFNWLFFHIFHIISLFNWLFFHIFHIFSLFNLFFFHTFQILSLFNFLFFHIFHIFSLFNLLFFHIFQIFPLFNWLFFQANPLPGHVTSGSHVGHAQWYILYYYSKKKSAETGCACAHDHFCDFWSFPLPMTSLPVRTASGDVTSGQGRFR